MCLNFFLFTSNFNGNFEKNNKYETIKKSFLPSSIDKGIGVMTCTNTTFRR